MAPKAFIDQLPLATRYAHFYVDVRIHELLNVPVTTGDFCVVYKVKQPCTYRVARRRACYG